MPWTKDDTSMAPKIIYTPSEAGPVGCDCLVYDPEAPANQRLVAYFSHLITDTETLSDIENSLGFS